MSATARLIAFGLALVAALVLGLGLGALVGPSPADDDPPRHATDHGMPHDDEAPSP